MQYERVEIPTNHSFLIQWHQWVHKEVSKCFKRDWGRIPDTVQNVRVRLLSKDFIGRWFFKHLTADLVDKTEAQRILGGAKITFIGSLHPVVGDRARDDSLWRVSDLLEYAQFDYGRYYYSIQEHTIDSDKVLRLLGYPKGAYDALASMYRQGRMKPSEFTEHNCTGKGCRECQRGRDSLRSKNLSLAHRWTDPNVLKDVRKLRWNDRQLKPFLRKWRRQNMIASTPRYIMRNDGTGIDAGLLKYAKIIIQRTSYNEFKRMGRTDDMARAIFNKGISPQLTDAELISWEVDEPNPNRTPVFLDSTAFDQFSGIEARKDVTSLMQDAPLSTEERDAIMAVDLMEMTIRQYAEQVQKPIQRIHRVRSAAMKKMRGLGPSPEEIKIIVQAICDKFDCTWEDLLGLSTFGKSVRARTKLFSTLYDAGMTIDDMRLYFSYPEERITAAINRQCLQEMRK
jgi:DNA-directed RNA polymerase specialized sigma24 family protein